MRSDGFRSGFLCLVLALMWASATSAQPLASSLEELKHLGSPKTKGHCLPRLNSRKQAFIRKRLAKVGREHIGRGMALYKFHNVRYGMSEHRRWRCRKPSIRLPSSVT